MLHIVVLDILTLMTHGISMHSANAVFYNNSHVRQGSCRVRTVREAVGERWSGDSMTESFVLDNVEYKLCRYRVTWDEARIFCSTHKSHLATLDTEDKVSFVVQAIAASGSVSEGYWIGARKYYGDFWMWDLNSKGLGSTISILDNMPISYPDREINDVHCLTIDRAGHVVPIFVPITCDQWRGFVCQRDSDRTFDNKMRMVAASQIGEEEFRLYSGRTTWAEAVVQCREEGLQIAEVNTVEEARVLAVSMLRNRPGIESAWIGGYTKKNEPGTWRWLASGKKIKNNEMRQRNFSESMGNCLLLDRHLCEIPVYVEAKCDRKRDVLCQKPPKKHLSKKPVAVVVDGCPYWIGLYPLEWSEARRSCESTNASLVVLDSPQTISHMMSLMLDSRAELRHIWTDGHRVDGQWEWNMNGEALSPFGKSFMPWCAEDDIYAGEFNCLNLDRENLKSPLVYGLSCNQKQSYVCQPHVRACVSRAISPSTSKFGFERSEATTPRAFEVVPLFRKTWHTRLGVTGTMPMTIDDYGAERNVLEPVRYLMDDSNDRKLDVTSWPQTSAGNYSTHTTTASRFALPAFPKFGIGVASAVETTTRFFTSHETTRNKKIKQLFATSSPSDGPSASLTTKNPIATRKPSRIDGKKSHRSTVVNSNFTARVGSTTSATLGPRKTSRIVDPKVYSKPGMKIATISTFLTAEYSNVEHRRTRKYTQTSPGRSGTKVTKMPTMFTKASNANDEKSTGTNKPSFRRAGSLRKITPPLAKVQKKTHLYATEPTTPYDAVDEDYYENYETRQTPDNHEEAVTDDAYEEEYEASENDRLEKKRKLGMKKDTENGASRSSISSIAEALSKNMQIALMSMLKKGIDDKKPQPAVENAQSTSPLADDIVEPTEHAAERRLRMKNNTKNLSLRPYYAFEGPMIVGLSGDSNILENSDNIGPAARGHSFKLIDKTMPDLTSKNDQPEASKHREYRRNNAQESSNEGINVPIVISALPSIAPNDASSLVQMGRYLKNKFQRELEKPGQRVEAKFYDERKENPRWPDGRYRLEGRKNANYYEMDRRLYPRGNSYVATSPFPSQRSKADVKPWQEIFKISWPEDNSTSSKIVNLDEAVFENNFSTPVRTSRSSKEDEEFPDLKIPKLIKEIKIDLDQRLLRDYLVALAKKVTRPNGFPTGEEDDWKDSWKFILGQVSRILDRMNFNVNGELVKVKIVSDDETNDSEVNAGKIPTRSNETRNNLTCPLEIREIYDSAPPKDITETTDSPELHYDENSMEGSSQEKSGSETISQEGGYVLDTFFSNATRRVDNPLRDDEKASTDTRKHVPQNYPPTLRSSVNRSVPRLNGNNLANWYARKYANSNISGILVAPAIVRPVGISRIYSFQPIMPQLHHKLAFNQVFAKSRVGQRLKNSSTFRNEYLPRGTLSKISGVKHPKRRFPEKIIAKTNFLAFRNSRNEAIQSRHRPMSNESMGNSEKAKNQSGNVRNPEKAKNQSGNVGNPEKAKNQSGNVGNPETAKNQSSSVGNPGKVRIQSGEKVNNCERNKLKKRDVERRTTSEENSAANDPESVNDRRPGEIVRYLDHLTEEPSIVSLRMMMNPREKAATRKNQQLLGSSELSDDPRTVELHLKFSGSAKKMVNYLRFHLSNDSRGSSLNRTWNGGTRNISSRISDKNRRRAMIHKLQEVSRMIAMKNDPPPWKTKSASRGDRNFRTWGTSESEKLAVDERRLVAASLLSNLRENNDQLTLYFDLKLGRVVKKPIKTGRRSRS